MRRRMTELARMILFFSGEEQRLFPIPTPLKPRLRRGPLKPFTLNVREDKYEKVADEDEGDKDKRGTAFMDRVLFIGAGIPPDACTSESICKSYFIAKAATKTALTLFQTGLLHPLRPLLPLSLALLLAQLSILCKLSFKFHASASAPSQQLPPNLPPSPCPPLLALASSGAAESGPLPVTKLPFPPPVPSVSSPRPPKRIPLALPLSSPPASRMQATPIGQKETVIEKDNGPLIKRDMLPLPDTAGVTRMGSLTTWWKGLAWTVRPVEDVE
ncbi:hypothetical protein DL96DRAFT_1720692 [Flagelloscypha sp. PMI_526]|nr:hypothetical protein DL96DRAFT_1720692 [Flagelloscypha sp. PMI_526]